MHIGTRKTETKAATDGVVRHCVVSTAPLKFVILCGTKVRWPVRKMYTKIRRKVIRYLFNFIKIIRNEFLHIQCSIHNAVTPLCNLCVGIPVNTREYFW
jgi:hypothetical protein